MSNVFVGSPPDIWTSTLVYDPIRPSLAGPKIDGDVPSGTNFLHKPFSASDLVKRVTQIAA